MDWLKGCKRIRGQRSHTGRSIDMFNLTVEETESMKEKNSSCEILEGEKRKTGGE